jgi:hypothetical protein
MLDLSPLLLLRRQLLMVVVLVLGGARGQSVVVGGCNLAACGCGQGVETLDSCSLGQCVSTSSIYLASKNVKGTIPAAIGSLRNLIDFLCVFVPGCWQVAAGKCGLS